ncbi:hypothetical protein [Spirosoma fluminis]
MRLFSLATFVLSVWTSGFLTISPTTPTPTTRHNSDKPIHSGTDSTKAKREPLFESDELLQLTLRTNMRVLLKDRGDTPVNHSGVLVHGRDAGAASLPVKLKVRGNFRRNVNNCSFPPLLIDFPKKKGKSTLFANQNRVKLVTHCQNEDFVVREYVLYQIYNLLTDHSFKARLAQVTYEDSTGKRSPQTKFAFLLEDAASVAKRNGTTHIETKKLNMATIDSVNMATVAVFEYMIGNTDWSVPFLHNIKLVRKPGVLLPIPIPYDFDHAGIVEAPYAQPAEQLNIQSVRERLYRGYVYPEVMFRQVFDRFIAQKSAIYALYQQNKYLDKTYIKRTIAYLDDFYRQITDKERVQAQFIDQGKLNTQHVITIRGLN